MTTTEEDLINPGGCLYIYNKPAVGHPLDKDLSEVESLLRGNKRSETRAGLLRWIGYLAGVRAATYALRSFPQAKPEFIHQVACVPIDVRVSLRP